MKRLILALAIIIAYQQYQIHELRELHEDAGAYIDEVADLVGDCGGYDSCSEAITYLRADVDGMMDAGE